MKQFQNSLNKRKEYLDVICKSQKSWKYRMLFYYLLIILSIAILLFTILMLIEHPVDAMGIFVFMCGAIGFSSIPFITSFSVKNTAKYTCGYPYSSMANGILILHEDQLNYIHWRVGKSEPAAYSSKRAIYKEEDQFVYTIHSSKINQLTIDKHHICHIKGTGHLSQPEWATTSQKRENKEIKSFSFLLDYENSDIENTIKKWAKKA